MSYHILSIDTPECSLSCKDGQVTCRSGTDTKTVPIEDVAAIIITSFSALLHSNLLLEAAKHGVADRSESRSRPCKHPEPRFFCRDADDHEPARRATHSVAGGCGMTAEGGREGWMS